MQLETNGNKVFFQGLKIIVIFWIVGMSIVGTPILIAHIGYKGFSLGYTISTVLRLIGITSGNEFVFRNLFFKNVVLIFIMIYLANYSIKISKSFFEKKANIKVDAMKYTVIAIFMLCVWGLVCVLENLFQ